MASTTYLSHDQLDAIHVHTGMRILVFSDLTVVLVLVVLYRVFLHRLLSLALFCCLRGDIVGIRRPVFAESSCAS